MIDQEKQKLIIPIGIAFFSIYFLSYFIFIRPNYSEIEKIKKTRNDEIGDSIEKYFADTGGVDLNFLKKEYIRENKSMEKELKTLKEYSMRPFPVNILPKDKLSRRHAYVREYLEKIQKNLRETVMKYRVKFSEEALSLGMKLPEEYTEDVEQDKIWLTQITNINDFLILILKIDKNCGKVPGIFMINMVTPLKPTIAKTVPTFIKEHPFRIQMKISLKGLLKVLYRINQKKYFLIVRSFQLSSDIDNRLIFKTKSVSKSLSPEAISRSEENEFYYLVDLELARMEFVEPSVESLVKKEVVKNIKRKIPF